MRARAAALAALMALATVLLSGSASAKPPWVKDVALIQRGLDRAHAAGWIDPLDEQEYRDTLAQTKTVMPKLRSSRYTNLAAVVHEVASFWKGYDAPRARTLFGMLAFNTRWFASHWDRKEGTDVYDTSDGVWYRAFPGIGFQFHPLLEFGKLNNFVAKKDGIRGPELAQALLDRAVPRAGGLAWEYYFRFGGGRPPWISGMAQAVAAQALSRAGTQFEDPQLTSAAQRAYKTVPSLTRQVDAGPWIRLYAFSGVTVLNAQLQTIVSLQDYVAQTGDQAAASLETRLESAAVGMLPRFDTGAWSLYSLGGVEAPLNYHKYVVQLLTILARRTQDPTFVSYKQRFGDDLRQPPTVRTGGSPGAIYPWPADGFRDAAVYRVWVSKRSAVRVNVPATGVGKAVIVSRGWHTIEWRPGKIAPGSYTPELHAVDVVGNASDTPLAPVSVLRDTKAPVVAASLAGRRLYWRGRDDASPWLSLRVVIRGSGGVRTISLGRRPFRGSAIVPGGQGTLYASDSSGNTTRVAVH